MTFPIGEGPNADVIIPDPFGIGARVNETTYSDPSPGNPGEIAISNVGNIPDNISGRAAGGALGISLNSGVQVVNGVVYENNEPVAGITSTGLIPIDQLNDGDPYSSYPGLTIPPQGPDWLLGDNTFIQPGTFGDIQGPFITGPFLGNNVPYTLGMENSLFANLGAPDIAAIQLQFVEAGVVDITDFEYGVWDDFSNEIMLQTMSHANQHGVPWQLALQNLGETVRQERAKQGRGGGGGGRRAFVAPTYRPPDYATLSSEIQQYAQSRLGRDLKDYEIELLAGKMSEDFRKAYDADVQAARADYNASVAGRAAGGTVETVDPAARFTEFFDERYAPEIDRIERVGDATTDRSLLMQSLIGGDATVRQNQRRNEL